jgi:Fur family transcriptional regulator, zinc uptake regulator
MRGGLGRNEAEVLVLLRAAEGPLSAYEIIRLMQVGGRVVAPPTVYRALKALEASGQARRIETLRSWAAVETSASAEGVVVICDDCGTVRSVAVPSLFESLHQSLAAEGFVEGRQTIEVHGRCGDCTGDHPR